MHSSSFIFPLSELADHYHLLSICRCRSSSDKSVHGCVDLGGRRIIKKKKNEYLLPSTGHYIRKLMDRNTVGFFAIYSGVNTYKYFLTALGKSVVVAGLKVKNLIIVPSLAQA
jgi:hypothetical protein